MIPTTVCDAKPCPDAHVNRLIKKDIAVGKGRVTLLASLLAMSDWATERYRISLGMPIL